MNTLLHSVFVTAAVVAALLMVIGGDWADGEAESGAEPVLSGEDFIVNKIHFLIHPLTYVPECEHSYSHLEEGRYQAYRECENLVRRRYHEAVDKMKEDEALVIYPTLYTSKNDPHPQELVDIVVMARRKLGRRLIVCSYPTTSAEFVKLAKEQGLTYDPQTVVTEGWGESFDGCVAKYCSIFTTELGLAEPIAQNFAMCVPDAVWALKAKFIDKTVLPSKIRFYVFETPDGRPMAIFFEPYLRRGEPLRFVDIPLDPARAQTWQYVGSATPKVVADIANPDGPGVRLPVCSGFTKPWQSWVYLLGKDADVATFRAALRQAKLVE